MDRHGPRAVKPSVCLSAMSQNMPEAACNSYDELDKRITLSYTHENTVCPWWRWGCNRELAVTKTRINKSKLPSCSGTRNLYFGT
jgi:hypothetical protein